MGWGTMKEQRQIRWFGIVNVRFSTLRWFAIFYLGFFALALFSNYVTPIPLLHPLLTWNGSLEWVALTATVFCASLAVALLLFTRKDD